MRPRKRVYYDVSCNVLFPLLLGLILYQLAGFTAMPSAVKNYLPDGLWAYSFMSAVLIIWNRRASLEWVVLVYLVSAGFEGLQFLSMVTGTGDIIDIAVYFIFFTLALIINNNFRHYIQTP